MNNLVIVESPTKAKTLQKFLGDKYQIMASMGHVRDLPKSELGVDVEHNFEPKYIIPRDKRKKANEIKKMVEGAKVVYLASDPDREGEAIAWHITHLTEKKPEFKRVVFHEITEDAIKDAFNHPRTIDLKLVDAQQARRVLDRLVGYKLSPLLWQKVKRGLSAGRVQSVALRLIVEREREVQAFKAEEYWLIDVEVSTAGPVAGHPGGSIATDRISLSNKDSIASARTSFIALLQNDKNTFSAALIEINNKKAEIKNEKSAREIVRELERATYIVDKVTKKEVKRYPYPPFTTSTMQQAASNKLMFTAKRTMNLAQGLYEHGLITYMRTDSFNLAASAVSSVRGYILSNFGKDFLPPSPKFYKSKSRNVQEAHEAIRPTDVNRQTNTILSMGLNRDHVRLYDLIWKRFLACQMNEAVMDQTSVDVKASPSTSEVKSQNTSEVYLLRATGSVIKFEGWLKVYGKVAWGDEQETDDEKEKILPKVSEKDLLSLQKVLPSQHFTEPPARYNEASLIKKLEELGIGRPSTYAPILSTIQERFYVERIERKFIPTALGFAVIDFLVKNFANVVDYKFTAGMEDELDEIARGERAWQPTLKAFYDPFEKHLKEVEDTAQKVKVEVEVTDKICPQCGKNLIVRIGKFGKFLACSGFPECKHTESLEEKINAKCPLDSGDIVVRHTKRRKTFYGCKNWPVCKYASWTKPKGETPEDKNPH